MLFLETIFVLGLIILIGAVGYLFFLTSCSFLYHAKVNKDNIHSFFTVVIPAHNEEKGITKTLEAIKEADYQEQLLKTIVISDNCNDQTTSIAKAAGALVVERFDKANRGKGAALDWFLRHHHNLYEKSDGVVFLDADSQPDPQMFKELSMSLGHPEVQVVQGFNGVANGEDSWRTGLLSISYNIFNHLRMAGSSKLFGTSTLKGLGMAFTPDILIRFGWPAKTIVEDLEFTMFLQQKGISVHYNPAAVVTSELSVTEKQANTQRRRWEGGRFQLMAHQLPLMTKNIFTGDFRQLPSYMELLIPPLSIIAISLLCWTVFSYLAFPYYLPSIFCLYSGLGFYVIAAQVQRKLSPKLWWYLASAPFYLLWKIQLYARMIISKPPSTWDRTIRKSEL